MADFRGIMSVCAAVIDVLRSSYEQSEFGPTRLDFQVFTSKNFKDASITNGVSLFLFRISPNAAHRTPGGRTLADGSLQRTKLPIDLHFMLTAWGERASTQQQIAGWMMRVMEDNPVLPAGVLNVPYGDVFAADESVDLVLNQLSIDDMFHIWEQMISQTYELSVPYMARVVQLESRLATPAPVPVVERRFRYALPEAKP